ncbi:MAG: hypothetical protein WBD55_05690 [Dehalococcoidia bacterium]
MSRGRQPNEPRRSLLLGGPDSWRRILLYGILAGVVLAVIAAVLAAAIGGSSSESLDPPQTPATPAASRDVGVAEPFVLVVGTSATPELPDYSSTLSPLLPPVLRASRIDSMRIPRSTALHIS